MISGLRQLLRDLAEPEAAHLPHRLRHRLGHGRGEPAARVRPGIPQADARELRRASARTSASPGRRCTSIPFEGLGKGRRIRLSEEDMRSRRGAGRRPGRRSPASTQDSCKLTYATKTLPSTSRACTPVFGDDAQPDPAGRGPLRQPLDWSEPAPGRLPRGRARDERVRRRTDPVGKIDPAARLALPGGRRAADEERRTRATPAATRTRSSSRARPSARSPARSTSTTSSSRRRPSAGTEGAEERRSSRSSPSGTASTRRTRKRSGSGTRPRCSSSSTRSCSASRRSSGSSGALTLVVGGIGVSNIMNVVVEERTPRDRHQDGARRALALDPRASSWSRRC